MDAPQTYTRLDAYLAEAKAQLLATARVPAFAIPSLIFPAMFYLFFGVIMGGRGPSLAAPTYLLATYATFGIIGPALFGFGVGLATERTSGELRLKQTTPMPAAAYFIAKIVLSLVFGMLIIASLYLLAAGVAGVTLERGQWVGLAAVLLVGTLPFCAMGLAVGAWADAQASVAIVNLIYLPMAFLSGLWIPITVFPDIVHTIAQVFPAYHLSQLALKVIEMDLGESTVVHLAALLASTLVFLVVAGIGFRRVTR